MQYGFYVLAAALAIVTGYFYIVDGGGDRTFAAFILTCAAAFMGYRFRLKRRLSATAKAEARAEESEPL